ncbi:MAG: N-acetylmuramoyl-L-alanine amidase [Oscillospiraceae bacterium]|nr:N-acetylmuramoyl-L-alanine amidase [Oscillospiraceae bacterium]
MSKFIRIFAVIFAVTLLLTSPSSLALAGGFDFEAFEYEHPGWLIVTHPDPRFRETSAPRMSLLGAADPALPLYINGEQIPTTPNGFFVYYAALEIGDNVIHLLNGDNEDYVTITRLAVETGGDDTPWSPTVSEYSSGTFGSTEYDNISRFTDFNDDLYGKTPLVDRTTFAILGEYDEFYVIGDGTMVFKSNVYMLDRIIPPIVLSGGAVTPGSNDVSISFEVSDYPLYDIELQTHGDNTATLKIFAPSDESRLIPDGRYILTADNYHYTEHFTVNGEPREIGAIVHELSFGRIPVGYLVEFKGGVMTVTFKFSPTALSRAVVLLDAGHGGSDPGALGPPADYGPMEKDFNLHVARLARDYLVARGVTVVFLRDDDVRIDIMDRIAHFHTQAEPLPDLVISVHSNSMPLTADFSAVQGPRIYHTLETAEPAATHMISTIAQETGNIFELPIRRNFAMARYTGGPSMLFEMGFLCNPIEYEKMIEPTYINRLGYSLGMAIEQYLTDSAQADIDFRQALYSADDSEFDETELFDIFDFYQEQLQDYQAIPAMATPEAEPTRGPPPLKEALILYIAVMAGVLLVGAVLYLPHAGKLINNE